MAFDEDAADGFRPPPHPDDRLWRHPSELSDVGHAAGAVFPAGHHPHLRQTSRNGGWLGIAGHMAVVGGVGIVATALALAVLGVPQQMRDRSQETAAVAPTVSTTSPTVPVLRNGRDPEDQRNPGAEVADEPDMAPAEAPEGEADATPEDGSPAPPASEPRAWLGVDGRSTQGHDRSGPDGPWDSDGLHPGEYGIGTPEGIVVTGTVEGSPADGNLEPGDVIVSVGGQDTPDMDSLLQVLADRAPGDGVDVVYVRPWGRRPVTASVTLAPRP